MFKYFILTFVKILKHSASNYNPQQYCVERPSFTMYPPPTTRTSLYHTACLLHTFTMQPQKPTVAKHILLSASPHVL